MVRRKPAARASPRIAAASALVVAATLAAGCGGGGGSVDGDGSNPAAAGPCSAGPAFAGSRLLTVESGGVRRRFFLHLPPTARAGVRLPVVLGLHGTGGKAGFFEQQSRLSRVADRAGFVAVYPYALQSPSRWTLPGQDGPDDVAFVRTLLADVQRRACVDPRRISAFGHSNGGGFAVELACDPRVGLAAAVSVCGGYEAQATCAADPPPSLLEVHGDADPIVPYPGARAFVSTYARWAGCAPRPAVDAGPDASRRETFSGCDDGAALVHLRRPGQGHDLPASAAAAAWAFLRGRHR